MLRVLTTRRHSDRGIEECTARFRRGRRPIMGSYYNELIVREMRKQKRKTLNLQGYIVTRKIYENKWDYSCPCRRRAGRSK